MPLLDDTLLNQQSHSTYIYHCSIYSKIILIKQFSSNNLKIVARIFFKCIIWEFKCIVLPEMHFYSNLQYNQIKSSQNFSIKKMDRFKIKHKLSQSPNHVNRLTVKCKNNMERYPQIQIRETLNYEKGGSSLSPTKIKHSPSGLFKNAHQIESSETYLINKKYRLSNTNESSSPQGSNGKEMKLQRPINCAKNNRSMSTSHLQDSTSTKNRVIQRTVSIVIDGRSKEVHNERELINKLSLIMLDQQQAQDEFQIQSIEESSIHGDISNFFGINSHFITDIINPEHYNTLTNQQVQ